MIQMNDGNKKHEGLEQKEVRDFLAKEFKVAFNKGSCGVEFAQKFYDEAKEQLEYAKRRDALEQIIKTHGWDWFDVSDYEKYISSEYFDFIGTKKEVKTYIKDKENGE